MYLDPAPGADDENEARIFQGLAWVKALGHGAWAIGGDWNRHPTALRVELLEVFSAGVIAATSPNWFSINGHPSAIDWDDLAGILYSCQSPSEEAAFEKRLDLISQLADWCQMHDHHCPYPHGPPDRHQPCAKCTRETRGTENEMWYCRANFPRDSVLPGTAIVEEDPAGRACYDCGWSATARA